MVSLLSRRKDGNTHLLLGHKWINGSPTLFILVAAMLISTILIVLSHYFGAPSSSTSSLSLSTSIAKDTITTNTMHDKNVTSRLFPRALDMMKRNIPLENVYTCFHEENSFSLTDATKKRRPPIAGLEKINVEQEYTTIMSNNDNDSSTIPLWCSCNATLSVPERHSQLCCQRRLFAGHKMGTFMQTEFESEMNDNNIYVGAFDAFPGGQDVPYIKDHLLEPKIDYRDGIIIRNIYDSLISGYLYHKEGKECWLDWFGNDGSWDKNLFPSYHTKRWMHYIELTYHKTKPYDTLCHCLANSTEIDGMRVYLDWVWHTLYGKTFQFWALSNGWSCLPIRKRVKTFCFEDLSSKTKSSTSVAEVIGFLTDNITKINEQQSAEVEDDKDIPEEVDKADQEQHKGHATSHDPTLRQRLLEIIQQIDRDDYNNDIAWLHSVLPCK